MLVLYVTFFPVKAIAKDKGNANQSILIEYGSKIEDVELFLEEDLKELGVRFVIKSNYHNKFCGRLILQGKIYEFDQSELYGAGVIHLIDNTLKGKKTYDKISCLNTSYKKKKIGKIVFHIGKNISIKEVKRNIENLEDNDIPAELKMGFFKDNCGQVVIGKKIIELNNMRITRGRTFGDIEDFIKGNKVYGKEFFCENK
jgi:hypothetical protein